MFEIKVSSKLNLYLDILGTRADGYHEIDTVMQSIDIYDTLTITQSEETSVNCPSIEQEKNTAYRAANLFFARAGIRGGVQVDIQKGIPLKAGMGGSSSDAAGLLIALNRIYQNPFDKDMLLSLAKEIGADVPFLLFGGCMRCRGIGEKLFPVINSLEGYYLILQPDGDVEAGAAYARYDLCGGKQGNLSAVLQSLKENDAALFRKSTANALERACISLCPDISRLLHYLEDKADAAFMTGSGSACVGFFRTFRDAKEAQSSVPISLRYSWIAAPTPNSVVFSKGY